MSAFCWSVEIYDIEILPCLRCHLKWWYLRAMCLVRGVNLVDEAIAMHDWLSSWTLQLNVVLEVSSRIVLFNSSIKVISGRTWRSAVDKTIYLASAVLKAISVWSVLFQKIGQFAYVITYPVLDITFSASDAFAFDHPPAKSALT